MVSMLACPRCSELPSVWLSNRFFMMAMVCSTNWVLVSLMGTWDPRIKNSLGSNPPEETQVGHAVRRSMMRLTGPCVSKNFPMLFLSLLKSMG